MSQTSSASPTPIPPAPPRATFRIGALFKLRDAKRRWPFAARASICMGVPVVFGWAAGDIAAGLMSTIGAFTALYGSDRPYLNRARHLAVVALAFAFAVSLGVWAASSPFLVVSTIACIAVVSTFLCSALRVGPPGAYMFTLACAAGTGMHAEHLDPLDTGLLVLAGGGFAWLMHMGGALFWPRGPERAAVAAAGKAVARFIEAVGGPEQDTARHSAALAMHESWTTLVSHQPHRPRPNGALSRLRALNRELNLLFVDAVKAASQGKPMPQSRADMALRVADQAEHPLSTGERTDPNHVPLGHHGLLESLSEAFRPWSPSVLVAARVGVAAIVAGTIGAALGLERAYWTTAAAVLILHQGFDWIRALQRGVERLSGTWVGLIVAGVILWIHPEGLWLAATLMLLQFIIEMIVVRNYALAVVFITAAALTIAAGGQAVPDVGHLLWVRGTDTTIGCIIGLAVLVLTTPRVVAVRIPQEIGRTLDAVNTMIDLIARGAICTPDARSAQRDLQHRTIVLLQSYDAGVGATPGHRQSAEQMWPTVVATQRLAYRVLSTCWTLETTARETAPELIGADGHNQIKRALIDLAEAIRTGSKPEPIAELPAFLRSEILTLRESLVYDPK